jgi:hypothetical protein
VGGTELRRTTADALTESYNSLVRASRHTAQLVTESDLFVLEHLSALRSSSQRLEVEQIVDAATQLSDSLPRRMRRQSNRGRVPTDIENEAQFPAGGFSSIERAGSLENLVTSELIYMNDEGSTDVDLFEVRYVEGELLYYSRDESVLVREQRVFTFVLYPELVRARVKDRDVPWQRLVVALGVIVALVQRLSEWLNESGLQFRVVFLRDPRTRSTPLSAERKLCQILLGEWVDKGVATVEDAASWEEEASAAVRTAQSDVVIFSVGKLPEFTLDPRVRMIAVDLRESNPIVSSVEAEATPWQSWLRATETLAHWLC